MKGNILVILLIGTVVVLSLGSAGYLFLQNRQLQSQIVKTAAPVQNPAPTNNFPAPTPVSTSSSTIDPTVNWKTYDNKVENFTFNYPSDFITVTPDQPYFTLDNPIISLLSNQSEYNTFNYIQESIISISTVYGIPISSCYQTTNQTRQINGTIFHLQSPPGGAAAGNHYDRTLYRTGTAQKCFEVALTVHTSSDWNNVDIDKSNSSIAAAKSRMEQILSTFKFL